MKISLLVAVMVIIAATLLVWRKKPVNDSVEEVDVIEDDSDETHTP